jgi:apolipoprotein N-acyltransferase
MMDVSVPRRLDRIPTWALLVAGALCVVLSVNRIPVPLLGWLAPAPLLVATTRLRTWRGRGLLLAVCLVTGIALGIKVVTEPISPTFGAMFGGPIGGALFVAFVAWDRIQRRGGPVVGLYAFAALMVLNDYLFAELSPGGDFGAIFACTQIENLPLLQLASQGGLGLITFVVVWPAAAIAALAVAGDPRRLLPHVIAALGTVVLATAWGSWRLDAALDGGPTLSVAAVTVDGRRGNGRIRASMPAWEANNHVMLATVPTTRVATWYSALGNWPVVLGLSFIVGAVGLGLRRRQWR